MATYYRRPYPTTDPGEEGVQIGLFEDFDTETRKRLINSNFTKIVDKLNGLVVEAGATNLGYTAATRLLTSSTGTDVTLPLVTSSDAGLAPSSGGGTTNFLRADLTWAAPTAGSTITETTSNSIVIRHDDSGSSAPSATAVSGGATTITTNSTKILSVEFSGTSRDAGGGNGDFTITHNTGKIGSITVYDASRVQVAGVVWTYAANKLSGVITGLSAATSYTYVLQF